MVNVGHPSRGCLECRRRRIKCDEARPTCGRCKRAGLACQGYRQTDGLMIRSMNHASAAKVQQRVRQRQSERATPAPSQGPPILNALDPKSESEERALIRTATSVGRPIAVDWQNQAVELLFMEWVEQPDIKMGKPGLYHQLPGVYRHCSGGTAPHVTAAVEAAALAYLRSTTSVEDFGWMAHRSYGRALVSLGEAMRDPARAVTGETLTAIWLLALFEVRTSVYRARS